MLILVFGGSGSGKSEAAESIAMQSGAMPRWYLATMADDGSGESRTRIEKHRKMRQGKGFRTLERSCGLDRSVPAWAEEMPAGSVILLEDLGNLVANELFLPEGAFHCAPEGTAVTEIIRESITRPILRLAQEGHVVIAVCDMIDEDGPVNGPEMQRYDDGMKAAVGMLAEHANGMLEVVAGLRNWLREPEWEGNSRDL